MLAGLLIGGGWRGGWLDLFGLALVKIGWCHRAAADPTTFGSGQDDGQGAGPML